MERTSDPAEADVIVFNTCSVREKAQEKVFADLGRVKHPKRARPHLMIAVGGCVATQEGGAIVERAPHVDVVFGPQTLHRLPELLERRRASGRPQVDISFPEIEKFDRLPPARVQGVAAFVSIMEAASTAVSASSYTRGEEVSRPFEDIIAEIAHLSDQGVKELTLLGQNVNAWRGDIAGQSSDFAELLRYVHELPVERIRYTTSHPREFTQRLIDAHAELHKLAPHVHLPVQSGSDRVLAAMKRGYTSLEYRSIVRRLRQARRDLSLSSDFIVGFPGESDADFEATLKLARRELRRLVLVRLQPAAGHAGGGPARRSLRAEKIAGCSACRRSSTARRARSAKPWSGRWSAFSLRARPKKRRRTRGAHGEQPRGELSRAAHAHSYRTCAHRRSPAPLPQG